MGLEFDVQKMEPPKGDKPARLLAYVYLSDGRMLNEEIVKARYGQVYTVPPNVKYVERIRKAEREARESKRGLWGKWTTNRTKKSTPNGRVLL